MSDIITAEQPITHNGATKVDTSTVRDRMLKEVQERRAAQKPEEKKEVKAETVNQAVTTTAVEQQKAEEKSSEIKAQEQIAQNQAKIEAEKKDAENAKIQAEAVKTEQKLAEATKEREWYEVEPTQEPQKSQENKDEVKYKEWEAKVREYEELTSDPFVEAYKTAKKAGKDITSFIKEVSPLDVDSIPTEKLFELSLQEEGLTDEEKSVEMDQFSGLTPLQKKRAVADFKEKLRKQDSGKLAKYVQDNKANEAEQQQFVERYNSEKSEFLSKMKDRDYMGIKLSQNDIDNAFKLVEHGFPAKRDDGSYNLPSMFELAVFRAKKQEISQNLINKGISVGREQVLKEMARVDRNDAAGKVLPDVTTPSKADQAKELMRKKFAR